MIFVKVFLYAYIFMCLLVLITWIFGKKLDLGEEEIQDNINNDGKWN